MFQPDPNIRLQIREALERELRKKYPVGLYREKKEIVEILNFIYDYHYNQICDIIRGVNTKDMVSFLLFQYEMIEREKTSKSNEVFNKVIFKETILYLLDLLVEKKSHESSDTIYFYENEFLNKLWVHAEKAVEYSDASNLTHRIKEIKTNLEILPPNSGYFLIHDLKDGYGYFFAQFQASVNDNIELRESLLNDNDLKDEIFQFLKDDKNICFKEEFDISYYEFGRTVLTYSANSKYIKTPRQIPCISDTHLEALSKHTNIPFKTIETLFNGITLREENYIDRNREIWNYTQQERSRKRPLIMIKFNGENWRLFSPKMLENRVDNMGEDIILNPMDRLPLEWQTKGIKKDFAQANTKFGKWFENKTIELLKTIDISGFKTGKKIRVNTSEHINIDSTIGPPDFIGYSKLDNTFVIIECKLLDCVFEPRGIQRELSKFLGNSRKKNYVGKFMEKINWLSDKKQHLKQAIEYQCKITIPKDCSIINYCFVTYYPTTLRYFYKEIPSPTLFELVDLYKKQKKWPFKFGIKK